MVRFNHYPIEPDRIVARIWIRSFQCFSPHQTIPSDQPTGDRDCLDGTDELNCSYRPGCGPDRFKCADGFGCIPKRWVCDGKAECRDGSDEIGCSQKGSLHCSSLSALGPPGHLWSSRFFLFSMSEICRHFNFSSRILVQQTTERFISQSAPLLVHPFASFSFAYSLCSKNKNVGRRRRRGCLKDHF